MGTIQTFKEIKNGNINTLGAAGKRAPGAFSINKTAPFKICLAPKILSFLKDFPAAGGSSMKNSEGSKNIRLLLAEDQGEAAAFAEQYNELVYFVSAVLGSKRSKNADEKKLVEGAWDVIHNGLGMDYNGKISGRVHESLKMGMFDCISLSLLLKDISERIGICSDLVWTNPRHTLVAFKDFFLETAPWGYAPENLGKCIPREELSRMYLLHQVLSEPRQVLSVSYYARGVYYFNNEKFKNALDDLTTAIALNRRNSDAFFFRGNVYLKIEAVDKAMEDLNVVLRRNPKDVIALNMRGVAYAKQEKYNEAKQDFLGAIELHSDYDEAHINLTTLEDAERKGLFGVRAPYSFRF